MMPKLDNYKAQPMSLYLLGGILFNVIFSLLALLILCLSRFNIYVNIFIGSFILVGWIFILNNAIPKKVNGLANDGYNVYTRKKSDIINKSLYIQLKIHSFLTKGIHLSQMPNEWFNLSELNKESLEHPILINNLLNKCALLMEKHNFESAKTIYNYIIENANKSDSFYLNESKRELMFLNIM